MGKFLFLSFVLVSMSISNPLLFAQFPPKMSTTGPEAAEGRIGMKKIAQISEGKSKLKVGPVQFSLSGDFKQTFNDNIGLTENNPVSDFIVTPGIGLGMSASLTPMNSLNGNFVLGYEKHLLRPELDQASIGRGFLMDPKTNLDFTFYTSGIIFNLYMKPSIQSDPVAVPQLSNLDNFRRFTNNMGASMEWDLNTLFINGSYARDTFHSFEDQFSFLDHNSDSFSLTIGYRFQPKLTLGMITTYTLTNYEETVQNGSNSYTTGFFASAYLTEYLSANVNLSFQGSDFDRGGRIGDNTDFGSVVYSVGLQNQLNRWLNHSVAVSKFTTLGVGANFTEIDSVNYQARLDILNKVTTSFSMSAKFLNDSASLSAEDSTQLSLGPSFSYTGFQHLTISMDYKYTQKDSNRVGSSYSQNTLFLNANYSFN